MSESKHTAGPWRVDETKTLGAYGVWTEYATHPGHDLQGYGSQICSMLPSENDVPVEQRNANAALIAASPCLLAAAEALWLDRNATQGDEAACRRLYDAWRALGAAIAKARGQS